LRSKYGMTRIINYTVLAILVLPLIIFIFNVFFVPLQYAIQ
jgi:hypothetical protein